MKKEIANILGTIQSLVAAPTVINIVTYYNTVRKDVFVRSKLIYILKLSLRLRFFRYLHRLFRNKYVDMAFCVFFLPIAFIKILYECVVFRKADNRMFQYELGLTAIIKNEAPYIAEWIEYYKLLGVKKFWLYSNNSSDNIEEVLAPYISDGCVRLRYLGGEKRQYDAYNDAIERTKRVCRYLIVVDADEFLYLNDGNVLTILKPLFAKYGKKWGGGNCKLGNIWVFWIPFSSEWIGYKHLFAQGER